MLPCQLPIAASGAGSTCFDPEFCQFGVDRISAPVDVMNGIGAMRTLRPVYRLPRSSNMPRSAAAYAGAQMARGVRVQLFRESRSSNRHVTLPESPPRSADGQLSSASLRYQHRVWR
jgi:hypothetical protein